jgi:hypothetical protein
MSVARSSLFILLLGACSPGPTLVLGRLPDEDAATDEDGGSVEPCSEKSDCQSAERPFCSQELERCVECLANRHCQQDEFCGDRSGRCIVDR